MSNLDPIEDQYEKCRKYYENTSPTIAGMLGGHTKVNDGDVDESRKLLRKLMKNITADDDENRPKRALDCGAGIGRVTKYVLSKFFDEIDLLEPNETFVEQAKKFLGPKIYGQIKNTFVVGMHQFEPTEELRERYDCIWGQWVYGYLTDNDLTIFLQKCLTILRKPNGIIVIKDNVVREDQDIFVDENDGFVTRSEKRFMAIFDQVVGLKLKEVFKQRKMPRGLLPVKMFILTHRDTN